MVIPDDGYSGADLRGTVWWLEEFLPGIVSWSNERRDQRASSHVREMSCALSYNFKLDDSNLFSILYALYLGAT